MNYSVYRCQDPRKQYTDGPWYRIQDVCPCDPKDKNLTGRGFTQCAMGVQYETPNTQELLKKGAPKNPIVPTGNLYQDKQNVPPQLWPRPLSRIGVAWRSAN